MELDETLSVLREIQAMFSRSTIRDATDHLINAKFKNEKCHYVWKYKIRGSRFEQLTKELSMNRKAESSMPVWS